MDGKLDAGAFEHLSMLGAGDDMPLQVGQATRGVQNNMAEPTSADRWQGCSDAH
jgi:hypothetical protein